MKRLASVLCSASVFAQTEPRGQSRGNQYTGACAESIAQMDGG
jgi:hypothetical protein